MGKMLSLAWCEVNVKSGGARVSAVKTCTNGFYVGVVMGVKGS